jgi:hypothetical protein
VLLFHVEQIAHFFRHGTQNPKFLEISKKTFDFPVKFLNIKCNAIDNIPFSRSPISFVNNLISSLK